MANKLTDMSKVRKVIHLYEKGESKMFISQYLSLSRNTVKKYIALYKVLGMSYDEIEKKSDSDLEQLFCSNQSDELSSKHKAVYEFFPYMERQLKKENVTRHQMWEEYYVKHPDGLKVSQFCNLYKQWSKKVNPVMHMEHKSGDKLFVDYAGKTLEIVDPQTGEVIPVQFFVSILGASQYTYAEASPSQKKEDFILSVENSLHFIGGVPAAIVPDNLKSAVTKSSRYEPTLNDMFRDFAEYYDTTILPARAYKPRDKSLAEGAVRILYTRIYTEIKKHVYHSIKELNAAIWQLLEQHNNTKLTGRPVSRKKLFEEDEKHHLSPLPETRYEIKYIALATVMQNGHVSLGKDKHYYSVPYQYLRKKVKIVYSQSTVEIFYKYQRIATHKRNFKPYNYTTEKEHLASTHRFVSDWTPQRFINWAEHIDIVVKEFIICILNEKKHPEQAYKSCMGVLSFAKKVGNERLINACKRAVDYQMFNYKIIDTILKRGLDQMPPEDQGTEQELPEHKNIRGNKYYQ